MTRRTRLRVRSHACSTSREPRCSSARLAPSSCSRSSPGSSSAGWRRNPESARWPRAAPPRSSGLPRPFRIAFPASAGATAQAAWPTTAPQRQPCTWKAAAGWARMRARGAPAASVQTVSSHARQLARANHANAATAASAASASALVERQFARRVYLSRRRAPRRPPAPAAPPGRRCARPSAAANAASASTARRNTVSPAAPPASETAGRHRPSAEGDSGAEQCLRMEGSRGPATRSAPPPRPVPPPAPPRTARPRAIMRRAGARKASRARGSSAATSAQALPARNRPTAPVSTPVNITARNISMARRCCKPRIMSGRLASVPATPSRSGTAASSDGDAPPHRALPRGRISSHSASISHPGHDATRTTSSAVESALRSVRARTKASGSFQKAVTAETLVAGHLHAHAVAGLVHVARVARPRLPHQRVVAARLLLLGGGFLQLEGGEVVTGRGQEIRRRSCAPPRRAGRRPGGPPATGAVKAVIVPVSGMHRNARLLFFERPVVAHGPDVERDRRRGRHPPPTPPGGARASSARSRAVASPALVLPAADGEDTGAEVLGRGAALRAGRRPPRRAPAPG